MAEGVKERTFGSQHGSQVIVYFLLRKKNFLKSSSIMIYPRIVNYNEC